MKLLSAIAAIKPQETPNVSYDHEESRLYIGPVAFHMTPRQMRELKELLEDELCKCTPAELEL